MNKRRVLVALAVFGAIVLAVALWPMERQPEYQGKSMREWLL